MPSVGTHLVDLRTLAPTDIPDVTISSIRDRVLSKYCDNVWDMGPYLPTKNDS